MNYPINYLRPTLNKEEKKSERKKYLSDTRTTSYNRSNSNSFNILFEFSFILRLISLLFFSNKKV